VPAGGEAVDETARRLFMLYGRCGLADQQQADRAEAGLVRERTLPGQQ
jgi:hypothetical protein